jgi:hypothetical protein
MSVDHHDRLTSPTDKAKHAEHASHHPPPYVRFLPDHHSFRTAKRTQNARLRPIPENTRLLSMEEANEPVQKTSGIVEADRDQFVANDDAATGFPESYFP